MTYARRRIDVTIALGTGDFEATPGNSVTLSGLRVQAQILSNGGNDSGTCECRIFGLSLSMMNQLTRIGLINSRVGAQNTIMLAAGNYGEALTTVYEGEIIQAFPELNNAPFVGLNVASRIGVISNMIPTQALSFNSPSVSADTIVSAIASAMGYQYLNGGVNGTLAYPYFYGSPLEQLKECARAMQFRYDISAKTVTIFPVHQFNSTTGKAVVLSPQTGMVGYPSASSSYIQVRSVFLPGINMGNKLTIQGSDFPVANRDWNIGQIIHTLESEVPNGAWFTDLIGNTNGIA